MENMIRLQSVGWRKSIKASDLQVGMHLMWNFGQTSEVVNIEPKGKKSIEVTEQYVSSFDKQVKQGKRTMRINTQVVAYFPKAA